MSKTLWPILPATISGLHIAHSILELEVSQLLHLETPREGAETLDLRSVGLSVSELSLRGHCRLVGQSVDAVHQLGHGELMILGVRRSSEILREELETSQLQEGDALIAITRIGKLPATIQSQVGLTELL